MALKLWCFVSAAIFLQISTNTWVFADDAGLNSTDTGSFNDSTTSLGGPLNDSNSNQEHSSIPAGTDQFNFAQFNTNQQPADQPQQEFVGIPPTRPPTDPNRTSTFPPLVHSNDTVSNGTDKQKTDSQTTQKPDNSKGGSGYFYGNFVVVLSGASVLHLLY